MQAMKTCDAKAIGKIESDFRFICESGEIKISSATLKAGQTLDLPTTDVEAEEGEGFTLTGQKIVQFVKDFPRDEIKCLFQNDLLLAGGGKAKYAFPAGSADDFAAFHCKFHADKYACSGSTLAEAFRQTAFSCSTDPSETPKTAVRLRFDGESLVAESTDEYRVSIHSIEIEDMGSRSLDLLIPRETAEALSSLLDAVETVDITPGDKHVLFEWPGTRLTSRLEATLGRKFPDLARFLKGEDLATLRVSQGDFQAVLKLAGINARKSYLVLRAAPGSEEEEASLFIGTNERDRGVSQDYVIAQEFSIREGVETVETIISYDHLREAISRAASPYIDLEFRKVPNLEGAAFVVKDGDWNHFLFPVTPNEAVEEEAEEKEESNEEA